MPMVPRWSLASGRFLSDRSHPEENHVDAEAFFAACERYQAMQEHHLLRLAGTEPLDLERLVFEREQRFADLRNHLTAMVYHLRTQADRQLLVERVQERLQALLQHEAAFTARLALYRDMLEQHRGQVQYGQKVLRGYGGLPTHAPASLLDTPS